MSVSETTINEKIDKLSAYINGFEPHLSAVYKIRTTLIDIQKVIDPSQDYDESSDDDPPLINPNDDLLGTRMTDARRLQIYTDCTAAADTELQEIKDDFAAALANSDF